MAARDAAGGTLFDPSQHGTTPDDKLGYSRHYAERIRDLGKTSKESWIKRLWNHMFGSEVSGPGSQSQDNWSSESPVNNESKSHSTAGRYSNVTVDNSENVQESRSAANANVVIEKEKEVRFSAADELNDHNSQKFVSLENLEPGGSKRWPNSSAAFPAKDLPVQLVNSPYLPPKDKIVYYRPAISSKSREDNRDGVVAAKLRYQKFSSFKEASSSAPNIRMSRDSTNSGGRRTNQPQSLRIGQEPIRAFDAPRPKLTREPAVIQLEKRAKVIADRAIKVSK